MRRLRILTWLTPEVPQGLYVWSPGIDGSPVVTEVDGAKGNPGSQGAASDLVHPLSIYWTEFDGWVRTLRIRAGS
jgi:hypothetical protein